MSIRPLDQPTGELCAAPHQAVETGWLPIWPAPATHTSLAAVDICAFGGRRHEDVQLHLRGKMYEFLADAFDMTRLPWRECYREDRGDGALIILPPAVRAEALLDPLASHLQFLLRQSNRLANDAGRLRLRMAVHAGDVHRDAYGVAGHAVNLLFRLLEAGKFKKLLAASDADVGLVVSEQLYQVATHRAGLVDADAYQRINVRHKETRTRAWVWLPPQHRPSA